MQLSKKQKILSKFCGRILKCTSNFEQFKKEDGAHVMCFRNYRLRKTWLDK